MFTAPPQQPSKFIQTQYVVSAFCGLEHIEPGAYRAFLLQSPPKAPNCWLEPHSWHPSELFSSSAPFEALILQQLHKANIIHTPSASCDQATGPWVVACGDLIDRQARPRGKGPKGYVKRTLEAKGVE